MRSIGVKNELDRDYLIKLFTYDSLEIILELLIKITESSFIFFFGYDIDRITR